MPPEDVRQRLLECAGQVFAQKGFEAASIREICGAAGANVAGVNYYFRDKQGLYIEAVKMAHCRSSEILSDEREWPADMSPTDKLHKFISIFLQHLLDEQRPVWHAQLMLREMAQPTEACTAIVDAYIRPMAESLERILSELTPAAADRSQRMLLGFSIVGQCLFYKIHQPIVRLLLGPETGLPSVADLADHIFRFSLAGMGYGKAGEEVTAPARTTSGGAS